MLWWWVLDKKARGRDPPATASHYDNIKVDFDLIVLDTSFKIYHIPCLYSHFAITEGSLIIQ